MHDREPQPAAETPHSREAWQPPRLQKLVTSDSESGPSADIEGGDGHS